MILQYINLYNFQHFVKIYINYLWIKIIPKKFIANLLP